MNKTKIDWCDATINCVYGCPNNCEYCYGNVLNKRFHFCKDWKVPEWKPEHLKEFYSKKSRSIFIDSMSDIGTWEQEWLNAVMKAIKDNPQHRYIALTKRIEWLMNKINMTQYGILKTLFIGRSVTTQAQLWDSLVVPHFYSIEPILEPIMIPKDMMRSLIIGAETGNRKGKVIPKKEWIDDLVRQADAQESAVFMKESLRQLMGDDFRQDKLPWDIER